MSQKLNTLFLNIATTSSSNNLNWENTKIACLVQKIDVFATSARNYARPSRLVTKESQDQETTTEKSAGTLKLDPKKRIITVDEKQHRCENKIFTE